jgi:hypothetical protein
MDMLRPESRPFLWTMFIYGLDAGRLSQAKRTFWKALTAVVHRTIAKVGRIGVTG